MISVDFGFLVMFQRELGLHRNQGMSTLELLAQNLYGVEIEMPSLVSQGFFNDV